MDGGSKAKVPSVCGGGGEYGLYNLSNIVENILALNPKELYLSEEKKKKNLFSSVHVLHKAGA